MGGYQLARTAVQIAPWRQLPPPPRVRAWRLRVVRMAGTATGACAGTETGNPFEPTAAPQLAVWAQSDTFEGELGLAIDSIELLTTTQTGCTQPFSRRSVQVAQKVTLDANAQPTRVADLPAEGICGLTLQLHDTANTQEALRVRGTTPEDGFRDLRFASALTLDLSLATPSTDAALVIGFNMDTLHARSIEDGRGLAQLTPNDLAAAITVYASEAATSSAEALRKGTVEAAVLGNGFSDESTATPNAADTTLVEAPAAEPAATIERVHSDFAATPELSLHGEAVVDADGRLQLVAQGQRDAASAAWLGAPLPLNATGKLEVYFEASVSGKADGLALVIHNDPRGTGAVGGQGSTLAYGVNSDSPNGTLAITPSVAFEVDVFGPGAGVNPDDPDYDHVAIALDGNWDAQSAVADPELGQLDDGVSRHYWATLSAEGQLSLYASQNNTRPATPILQVSLGSSLVDHFGAQLYVGFTGSSGTFTGTHRIHQAEVHLQP